MTDTSKSGSLRLVPIIAASHSLWDQVCFTEPRVLAVPLGFLYKTTDILAIMFQGEMTTGSDGKRTFYKLASTCSHVRD